MIAMILSILILVYGLCVVVTGTFFLTPRNAHGYYARIAGMILLASVPLGWLFGNLVQAVFLGLSAGSTTPFDSNSAEAFTTAVNIFSILSGFLMAVLVASRSLQAPNKPKRGEPTRANMLLAFIAGAAFMGVAIFIFNLLTTRATPPSDLHFAIPEPPSAIIVSTAVGTAAPPTMPPFPTPATETIFVPSAMRGSAEIKWYSPLGDPVGEGKGTTTINSEGSILTPLTGTRFRVDVSTPNRFRNQGAQFYFDSDKYIVGKKYENALSVERTSAIGLSQMLVITDADVRCSNLNGWFRIEQISPKLIISFGQTCERARPAYLEGVLIFTPDPPPLNPTRDVHGIPLLNAHEYWGRCDPENCAANIQVKFSVAPPEMADVYIGQGAVVLNSERVIIFSIPPDFTMFIHSPYFQVGVPVGSDNPLASQALFPGALPGMEWSGLGVADCNIHQPFGFTINKFTPHKLIDLDFKFRCDDGRRLEGQLLATVDERYRQPVMTMTPTH